MTTIEGGVITLGDAEKASLLRLLANDGRCAIAWDRYAPNAVPAPAEAVAPGFKYRMHNVSAAVGLAQLEKLPGFLAARRRLARIYQQLLGEIDEIRVPRIIEDADHAWHLMIVRLRLDRIKKSRDEIAEALRRENVQTGIHFYGLHLHQFYQDKVVAEPAGLPHATAASYDLLSLPLHPGMTDKNVREVVDGLKKVFAHAR